MTDPVIVARPRGGTQRLPLVFDSPHSGTVYPDDMRPILDPAVLRQNEDSFVDAFFDHVPDLGAVFVQATFPRTYIDVNRATADVEVGAIEGAWPHPVANSIKIGRGAGLFHTRVLGEHRVYGRKLAVAEIEHRIDRYWRPYHDALAAELDRLHAAAGAVWHVNCHSMPSRGNMHTEDGPVARADFVLGDRDGTTCDAAFTEAARDLLAGRGYDVAVNWPMKGVELVRRHGRPGEGRHSLQIEINRRLYLHEASLTRNPHFPATLATVRALTARVADFVRAAVV